MTRFDAGLLGLLLTVGLNAVPVADATAEAPGPTSKTSEFDFKARDGVDLYGKLVLPAEGSPRAVVVYVQTAEGATIDQRRPLGEAKTFNYFDVYREALPKMGVGFFSYEGRGIRMGDAPPRYEQIDREIYNSSTLANKVQDVLSAVKAVRRQEGLSKMPIILLGASEGTLLAVEAAAEPGAGVDGLALYGVMASNMRHNFKYILTDGAFLPFRPLDKDSDGVVTKAEWDSVVKHAGIEQVDRNGDGQASIDDIRAATQPLIDAVDNEDFDALQQWATSNAAVAVPDNWFKDHFAHGEMWSFLQGLKIPVGMFHGDRDSMASLPAAKELQRKAQEAGLTNVEFHDFEGLDHTLNIGQYFVTGEMPAGHQAIFQYIDRIAPKR